MNGRTAAKAFVRWMLQAGVEAVDRGFRVRNRKRPKVLLYSDSRGLDLTSWLSKSPIGRGGYRSYVGLLRRRYCLYYQVLPDRYTTIVDFLEFADERRLSDFDSIVLHCGIVDFSPRPLSNLRGLREHKGSTPPYPHLFREEADYHARPFTEEFRGEPTTTLYSRQYLTKYVLPRLRSIPGLIWVSSSPILSDWNGDHSKGRPANIDTVVSSFDSVLVDELEHVVDLHQWLPADVKRLTTDNVHFTAEGFAEIARLIGNAIDGGRDTGPADATRTITTMDKPNALDSASPIDEAK